MDYLQTSSFVQLTSFVTLLLTVVIRSVFSITGLSTNQGVPVISNGLKLLKNTVQAGVTVVTSTCYAIITSSVPKLNVVQKSVRPKFIHLFVMLTLTILINKHSVPETVQTRIFL